MSLGELWFPRENPEIGAVRASDHRVLIVFAKREDVVSAIERTEKRDLETTDTRVVEKVGFSFGFIPFALVGAVTAVQDVDTTILT